MKLLRLCITSTAQYRHHNSENYQFGNTGGFMMKKWSIYFFTFLLLVGCTKTEESENVQANEENNSGW